MLNLDKGRVILFGGIGTDLYNDMRCYDSSDNRWRDIKYENEDKHYIPGHRFGHSMDLYKNKIIVHGGAGHYIKTLKSRFTFSDLRMFDLGKLYCGSNLID